MLLEKYKIDEFNQTHLDEHQRKFEFVTLATKAPRH